jgi:hypothetical protein
MKSITWHNVILGRFCWPDYGLLANIKTLIILHKPVHGLTIGRQPPPDTKPSQQYSDQRAFLHSSHKLSQGREPDPAPLQ